MTDTTSRALAMSHAVRDFLSEPTLKFATLATIDPDGTARQAVIWYRFDDGQIIINSRAGRRWPTNLLRDPRASIAIADPLDGYRWVGMTGSATPIPDQATAQADIAAMARRYHADDPADAERQVAQFETQERISFRFRPAAIHEHLE